MFERFKQRYQVTSRIPPGSGPIVRTPLESTPGYEKFMREYAGATFNNGLYRIHTLDSRTKWEPLITEAFPGHAGRFSVFAYDWVGRHFALDARRRESGEPLVLLFDPGFGEVLEVPGNFIQLHEHEVIEYSDAALLDHLFAEWLQGGNRAPGPTECVGFKVSLFLGGLDQLSNYELTDMEVYWSFNAQLRDQTQDLPDGTPIGDVKID